MVLVSVTIHPGPEDPSIASNVFPLSISMAPLAAQRREGLLGAVLFCDWGGGPLQAVCGMSVSPMEAWQVCEPDVRTMFGKDLEVIVYCVHNETEGSSWAWGTPVAPEVITIVLEDGEEEV